MNRAPLRAGVALLVGVAIALAACSPPAATPRASGPGGSANPGFTCGPLTTCGPLRSPGASAAGAATQTDTEWGRIWDALPSTFPLPEGAIPATDTGEGATSAQLSVPRSVADVAGFFVTALGRAGWSVNRDGPLEDGSIDVTAAKGEGCQLAISVLPVGDGSLVNVLYGAGCPFD